MKTIPLVNSDKCAMVDDVDYLRVLKMKWRLSKYGYAERHTWVSTERGTKARPTLHTTLMGKAPQGKEWDHKNRIRLDNRRENLRAITHQQNLWNMGPNQNNTSGFVGVYFWRGYWVAQISINNARTGLGYFKTPEAAARVYDATAYALRGKFARLNFPIKRFPRVPKSQM